MLFLHNSEDPIKISECSENKTVKQNFFPVFVSFYKQMKKRKSEKKIVNYIDKKKKVKTQTKCP